MESSDRSTRRANGTRDRENGCCIFEFDRWDGVARGRRQWPDAGPANDFSTLKAPDADRFELWLRDLLQTKLDATAAGLPSVEFLQIAADHVAQGLAEESAVGALVCRVSCPASVRPVYLRGKGTTELWVRVGNSTRGLAIDDAVSYIRHRWPQSLGNATRDRIAALRRTPLAVASVGDELDP